MRAWRALDRFEGRAALRTWLFGIATNVCIDMMQRRPASGAADGPVVARIGEQPGGGARGPTCRGSDRRSTPASGWTPPTPPRRTIARDSVRVAFVAALQHLPARQRAVLILRDVLRWRAGEVADAPGHDDGRGEQHAAPGAVGPGRRPRRPGRAAAAARRGPGGGRPLRRRVRAARHGSRSCACCATTPPSTCRRTCCGSTGPRRSPGGSREHLGPCNGHVFRPVAVNGTPALPSTDRPYPAARPSRSGCRSSRWPRAASSPSTPSSTRRCSRCSGCRPPGSG